MAITNYTDDETKLTDKNLTLGSYISLLGLPSKLPQTRWLKQKLILSQIWRLKGEIKVSAGPCSL